MKKNQYNAPQSRLEGFTVAYNVLSDATNPPGGSGLMGGGGDGAPKRRGLDI